MMADRIAESINATLEAVNSDENRNIDSLLPHLRKSAEFQRLIVAHISRFFASDAPIPERVEVLVTHPFWLGFECGRALESSAKLEAMLSEKTGGC
jgi:hypothetical protein